MHLNKSIRVYGRKLRRSDGHASLTFDVDGLDVRQLRFDIDDEYADFIGDGYDSAVLALLVPAMQAGMPLVIEGSMSPRLLWNINEHVGTILRLLFPELSDVGVTCRAEDENNDGDSPGTAVLTGLSNGIDSLTACRDHLADGMPPGMRVTHLLFNNVGSHGRGKKGDTRQRLRWQRARATAADIGLPIIKVSSNLDEFYALNFQATHTVRNASVALALQRGACRWLYASGCPYSDVHIGPSYDLAYADAILLPLLSTERMELNSTGAQYSRVAKTARIADFPIAWRRLDVCARREYNCSRCWKCLRTLLTLDLLGKVENFSEVFDLTAYRKRRRRFVAQVLASQDPLLREVKGLMKEVGYRPDPVTRIYAAAAALKELARLLAVRMAASHTPVRFIRGARLRSVGKRFLRGR